MKRLITSAGYVAFLVVFFLLKAYMNNSAWFDIPIYAFSLVGTYEILNAIDKDVPEDGKKISPFQKIVVWCYAGAFVPLYVLLEQTLGMGVHAMFFLTAACFSVIFLSFVISYDATSIEGTGKALFACFYPTGLLCFLLLINHLADWRLSCFAVFFTFTVSPCSDSFAYLFGKYLRGKFPKKMSPVISPNKTVVGCIGGLFGGAFFGVVAYFIYHFIHPDFLILSSLWLDILFCVLLGLAGSLVSEVGDLLESAIKRKVGLKDSGKILPGHGGILDRIDSTIVMAILMFAAFGITLL